MITLFHYYNFVDCKKILQTYSFAFIYKTVYPSLDPSIGPGVKVRIVWNVHYLKNACIGISQIVELWVF